jgi:c-di-GMP-binding flagellar brake protein YcgR
MTLTAKEALDAMAEIERSTPQQIKTMRSSARIALRAKVTAQPANSSQRNSFQTHGVLGDISRGGCLILFSDPLAVGDVYRLSFDRSVLDLESQFARCLRCRLVRENAFEAGFSFFQPMDLSKLEKSDSEELFDIR